MYAKKGRTEYQLNIRKLKYKCENQNLIPPNKLVNLFPQTLKQTEEKFKGHILGCHHNQTYIESSLFIIFSMYEHFLFINKTQSLPKTFIEK